MIPMIIVALFYAPVLLPLLSMVIAVQAGLKLGQLSQELAWETPRPLERAYGRFTERLLNSRLFPAF